MDEQPIIEQKESVKLSKMSKGNYNWEIKLLGNTEEQLERLKKINDDLNREYGGQNGEERS